VIKIDKKTFNPKILNDFGLTGFKRFFKRSAEKQSVNFSNIAKPITVDDKNKLSQNLNFGSVNNTTQKSD